MAKMNVRRISQGLIAALREEDGYFLCEIMDRHEALGLLVPGVNCPCDSLSGDDDDHLFILAFLEVLRHHVNLGQVEGSPEDDTEEDIWQKWLKGELKARRLHRPDEWIDPSCEEILPRSYRIITQIPLWLSDKARTLLEAEDLLSSTRNRVSSFHESPMLTQVLGSSETNAVGPETTPLSGIVHCDFVRSRLFKER